MSTSIDVGRPRVLGYRVPFGAFVAAMTLIAAVVIARSTGESAGDGQGATSAVTVTAGVAKAAHVSGYSHSLRQAGTAAAARDATGEEPALSGYSRAIRARTAASKASGTLSRDARVWRGSRPMP